MESYHLIAASLILSLVGGGSFIAGKKIETRMQDMVQINVDGEGKVSAAPDIAELSFGMQTGPQKTAKAATDKLTTAMQAAFEAVKALGIEEKDIRTEYLSLNPVSDWVEGREIPKGFEATESLRVKVRDLDKVSSVIEAATQAGANQAGGISFTIDEPEAYREQARAEAIVKAKEKAQKLAESLGMKPGNLKGFSEGWGGVTPMPMYARSDMAVGGAMEKSLPLPEGEQDITVTVNLMYELE